MNKKTLNRPLILIVGFCALGYALSIGTYQRWYDASLIEKCSAKYHVVCQLIAVPKELITIK